MVHPLGSAVLAIALESSATIKMLLISLLRSLFQFCLNLFDRKQKEMGNQFGTLPPTQSVSNLYHELNGLGFSFEDTLGQGRILKTLRCIHDEGTTVVKVFKKSGEDNIYIEQVNKLIGNASNALFSAF
jgi:hypothetical protein